MRMALRNLLSTPAAVLNRAGLELHVGVSSEDPMVGRNASEAVDAYLSVYEPGGQFRERLHLGRLAANRRQLWPISEMVRTYGFTDDHLVVVHRVPAALVDRFGTIDEPVQLDDSLDYHLCRAYVQYSYPSQDGAHGGVIYEIPPRYNEGPKPSTVLTFSPKVVLSGAVDTSVVLLNCSSDPAFATTARFAFGLYSLAGESLHTGVCTVPPFGVRAVEVGTLLPSALRLDSRATAPTYLNLFGVCDNASLIVLMLSLSPALGAVSVEHTHAPQGYLMPFDVRDKFRLKNEAMVAWRGILGQAGKEIVS